MGSEAQPRTELRYGAQCREARQDEAIEEFRDRRLGQFVHFGLYALTAGSWQGREHEGAAEFLPKWAKISPEEWRGVADDFALPAFDPQEWATAAERMGARYVTITTKHHEGFCLWPSMYTDFHVGNTPYGKDLLGELIAAYTQHGIAVHLYYSVLDWDHPDWRYSVAEPDDAAAFDRYLDFAEAQLVELAERYPEVGGFWFDGTWDDSVRTNGGWTLKIENALKQLVPGAVINSRLRADENGARHFDSNGELMGDFESGYERRLPDPWDRAVTRRDWEACMTIAQHTWGYHAGDWATRTFKHPWELADMVAQCASQNGNILINIGPRGDGGLQQCETAVTDRLGDWVHRNGDAIHGTGHVDGWDYQSWGYLTTDRAARLRHTSIVHAFITRPPAGEQVVVRLPRDVTVLDVTIHGREREHPRWRLRAADQLLISVDSAAIATDGPAVLDLHISMDDSPTPPTRELV